MKRFNGADLDALWDKHDIDQSKTFSLEETQAFMKELCKMAKVKTDDKFNEKVKSLFT